MGRAVDAPLTVVVPMSYTGRMNIQGLRAVVTGGAMGIGLATVKRLLAEGCSVAVWDYNEKAIDTARAELEDEPPPATASGGRALFLRCDVTSCEAVESAARETVRELGGVDILVNNAGTVVAGLFHESDLDAQRRLVDVNLNALLFTTRAFLPGMYERNSGVIVNISSAAGALGVAGQAVYSATKWAAWGFTESLRHEARNLGKRVHVASVHPSYIAHGLFEGARLAGLGGLIVPRVKSHDVVARAIVKRAIRRRKTVVFRPRSVRVAVLLRGILPDRLFFHVIRGLNVHTSMQSFSGRNHA